MCVVWLCWQDGIRQKCHTPNTHATCSCSLTQHVADAVGEDGPGPVESNVVAPVEVGVHTEDDAVDCVLPLVAPQGVPQRPPAGDVGGLLFLLLMWSCLVSTAGHVTMGVVSTGPRCCNRHTQPL